MARNQIHIDASTEAVYGLLADPRSYSRWVVGARTVKAADPDWPQPGTTFDHAVGVGPLALHDSTSVVRSVASRQLELHARAKPMPPARIWIELEPAGDGTRLTMDEEPANRLLARLMGPVGHRVLWLRNREALRRLKRMVEDPALRPTEKLPARDG
jgi:carbon monoxide dehydrogenase subunit G